MAYRENELENVLGKQFEEAKATLEEMAEKDKQIRFNINRLIRFNNESPQLEDALTTLGFRKEELNGILSFVHGYLFAYVRENENGLEILADHDLSTPINYGLSATINTTITIPRVFHLYQIPAGKNIQEWYRSYNYSEPQKKRDNYRLLGITFGGVSGLWIGATLGAVIEKYLTGDSLILMPYGVMVATGLVGTVTGCKIGNCFNELVSKGPEALRYITKNSKYEAPQLRIQTKPRIIDEEFTDESEYQATLEALAIEEQSQERKRK